MSQAAYREAAVTFFADYAGFMDIKLQTYPGRPRTIYPPTAFVDKIIETYTPFAGDLFQRVPLVECIILHGLFDSQDAVDQKDAFVDGLLQWVVGRAHQAGANTLIRVSLAEDIPDFVSDWLPPDQQRTYFATRITLEGFGTN